MKTPNNAQTTLSLDNGIDEESTRSLLDHLLTESKLYTNSKEYKELLDFSIHMRNFAPFNAMLIHIQKPGILFAASAYDWATRFERKPKQDARPLLILWPFGPVALVYDMNDTEGKELPKSVMHAFITIGPVEKSDIDRYLVLMAKKGIMCSQFDGGEGKAGSIQLATFSQPVSLATLKADARFESLALIRQSRLAVMPVSESQFRDILEIGKRATL